jgi:hypothetical protein
VKYLRFAAIGLVPMVAVAFWLRSHVIAERDALKAFCQATPRGAPVAEVQARAAAHGWALTPAGGDEQLVEVDLYSYRMGCVLTVKQGRVVRTREGELPQAW